MAVAFAHPDRWPAMTALILPLDEGRAGPAVVVKDLIDVAGTPTTAGSRAVARWASPARADAACLAGLCGAIAAGRARLVGKANLHELAAGATGVNPWFGTPVNPLDPALVPGGSSSGSAVAVATGLADLAIGTDTAGSVRIPSACCGTAGLKTTWGRVPTAGVWPLAPSLDTVGPMARDVAGVVAGMALLEPGFEPAAAIPTTVGRVRLPAEPSVDAAVDAAFAAAGLRTADARLPGWAAAGDAVLTVILAEAWTTDGFLLESDADLLGEDVRTLLELGRALPAADLDAARGVLDGWRVELGAALGRHGVVALPTLVDAPPTVAAGDPAGRLLLATAPINGAGVPSLALPIPGPDGWPASLQLVGPAGGEEVLVALARRVEEAVS
ncbi:MAG TPA: amidase [Acidimicrobiales bacterium]|nr:amidase [Acidimicrobiales bacterium]